MITSLLKKEIDKKVSVTNDEVRAFYEQKKQNFEFLNNGKPVEFNKIKDKVTERLTNEKQNQVFETYINNLKKSYIVNINMRHGKSDIDSAFAADWYSKQHVFVAMGTTEAPLNIITNNSGYHYFIKVVDWTSGNAVLTIFICSGHSVQVDVPLGSYRIKYAAGKKSYGETYLFGSETLYSEADKKFDFKMRGNQAVGYTVELIYTGVETCGLKGYQRLSFDILQQADKISGCIAELIELRKDESSIDSGGNKIEYYINHTLKTHRVFDIFDNNEDNE